MASQPDITIAIPTYRREAVLINTIIALFKQSHENFELLIVDQSNEHKPETETALADIKDPRYRYIKTAPPSLPAARNFCLKNAKAPIVLFLDDDIEPSKDLVKYHLQAFKEHPDANAIGGRVTQDGFPVKKEVLRFDEYGVSHGVFTATEPDYTNTFPGGNHSIKVDDALSVGGYDSRYYYNAFREESDMSLKMIRSGMKIFFEPRAVIHHLAANEGGTRAKAYTYIYDSPLFYRNEIFFTLRVVAKGKRIEALRRKYREYCLVVRHKRAYRRRALFFLGLVAAVWRNWFGRQIITKEVSS
jgi:GT2 family glycosyltransferase